MSRDEEEDDSARIFVADTYGLDDFVAVFEECANKGTLYLSDLREDRIIRHLHIYDNGGALNVCEEDVQVVWSIDLTKCAVIIWGRMRGVMDINNNQEERVKVESRDTPGIRDPEWLKGFEEASQIRMSL